MPAKNNNTSAEGCDHSRNRNPGSFDPPCHDPEVSGSCTLPTARSWLSAARAATRCVRSNFSERCRPASWGKQRIDLAENRQAVRRELARNHRGANGANAADLRRLLRLKPPASAARIMSRVCENMTVGVSLTIPTPLGHGSITVCLERALPACGADAAAG